MRAFLDACVLFPTVLREVLVAVAAEGLYTPLWSARVLEEWARATARLGPAAEVQARGEIALLRARWPEAEVRPLPEAEARLWLPDADDVHVLAAAVAGSAEVIVTFNASDFPRRILADEGIDRQDPDGFLMSLLARDPDAVARAAQAVRAEAERLSGQPWEMRRLLKKAGLPRLGKALA
jgi:predicted nucleic acid-binding protein